MARRSPFPNLDEFLAGLDRAEVLPVYAVFGEEEYLKAEAIVAIKAKAIGDGDPAMCYAEFDGETADCKDVFDELRTLPFLSKRRVVLLEKADKFLERFREQTNVYVESPSNTGTLILSLPKLDSRTKLAKALLEQRAAVQCRRMYDNQLPGWIMRRVRSLGKSMDAAAARMLAEFVGADLGVLVKQIEKLTLFVGERKRITSDDVAEVAITDRTRTVFEITECMSRRDTANALKVLNQFAQKDSDVYAVLPMLALQLRRLWKTKQIAATAGRDGSRSLVGRVAKDVGMLPRYAEDLIRQAATFSTEDLSHRHRLVLECDLLLKSTSDDPKVSLEALLVKLCR